MARNPRNPGQKVFYSQKLIMLKSLDVGLVPDPVIVESEKV